MCVICGESYPRVGTSTSTKLNKSANNTDDNKSVNNKDNTQQKKRTELIVEYNKLIEENKDQILKDHLRLIKIKFSIDNDFAYVKRTIQSFMKKNQYCTMMDNYDKSKYIHIDKSVEMNNNYKKFIKSFFTMSKNKELVLYLRMCYIVFIIDEDIGKLLHVINQLITSSSFYDPMIGMGNDVNENNDSVEDKDKSKNEDMSDIDIVGDNKDNNDKDDKLNNNVIDNKTLLLQEIDSWIDHSDLSVKVEKVIEEDSVNLMYKYLLDCSKTSNEIISYIVLKSYEKKKYNFLRFLIKDDKIAKNVKGCEFLDKLLLKAAIDTDGEYLKLVNEYKLTDHNYRSLRIMISKFCTDNYKKEMHCDIYTKIFRTLRGFLYPLLDDNYTKICGKAVNM